MCLSVAQCYGERFRGALQGLSFGSRSGSAGGAYPGRLATLAAVLLVAHPAEVARPWVGLSSLCWHCGPLPAARIAAAAAAAGNPRSTAQPGLPPHADLPQKRSATAEESSPASLESKRGRSQAEAEPWRLAAVSGGSRAVDSSEWKQPTRLTMRMTRERSMMPPLSFF